jgi:hypothetical protein
VSPERCALACVREDRFGSAYIRCLENCAAFCVDRIRHGLATAREGEARDPKGSAEEWKRLQQSQRSGREEGLPVGLDRNGVKQIHCPLPQAVSSGRLIRESVRRIHVLV